MPPKKSKAARGASPAKAEEKEIVPVEDAEKENKDDNTVAISDDEEDAKSVDIFAETVVTGKRKRSQPVGEAKLWEWIEANFEEKEEVHYKFNDLYEAYVKDCINEGHNGCLDIDFSRVLRTRFPKGYALKEDSKFKGDIKERKKLNRPKVQGDTFKMKPKEVLEKTFQELANP